MKRFHFPVSEVNFIHFGYPNRPWVALSFNPKRRMQKMAPDQVVTFHFPARFGWFHLAGNDKALVFDNRSQFDFDVINGL